MIDFTVPGEPQPEKKRQRFFKRGERTFVGPRTDEPEQQDFKARIALFATDAGAQPVACPVRLTIIVYRSRPPSYPQRATKTKPWPWAWITRPDRTNYEKIVEDALNGICWLDDAQIIDGVTLKRWGAPGVRVIVEELRSETDCFPMAAALLGWVGILGGGNGGLPEDVVNHLEAACLAMEGGAGVREQQCPLETPVVEEQWRLAL